MEFKEIEGKRYVAFNNILIVIVTALVCFVIGLFILIYVLHSRADAIFNDPLIFGAKIYNVSICNCLMNNEEYFNFNQNQVWKVQHELNPIFDKP